MKDCKNTWLKLLFFIALAVCSRLFSSSIGGNLLLPVMLLAAVGLAWRWSFVFIFFSLLISDGMLVWYSGFGLFGEWSYFTYSGYLLLALCLAYWPPRERLWSLLGLSVVFNVAYWLWTNLGTWLVSGMYSHDGVGLLACYTLGLPFLRNAVIAGVVFLLVYNVLQLGQLAFCQRSKKTGLLH